MGTAFLLNRCAYAGVHAISTSNAMRHAAAQRHGRHVPSASAGAGGRTDIRPRQQPGERHAKHRHEHAAPGAFVAQHLRHCLSQCKDMRK